MRLKALLSMLLTFLLSGIANAQWVKINDVDYTWGAFDIYHISLFSETGKYQTGTRPLLLTLQYKKPWAGRDIAVSFAKTWRNLGIKLPEKEQEAVILQLRKNFPDINPGDTLHYISLTDRGYFILNDRIIAGEYYKEFNDAIVATWLDPKMDISRKLLAPLSENNIEVQKEQTDKSIDLTEVRTAELESVEQTVENIKKATTEAFAVQKDALDSAPNLKVIEEANKKEQEKREAAKKEQENFEQQVQKTQTNEENAVLVESLMQEQVLQQDTPKPEEQKPVIKAPRQLPVFANPEIQIFPIFDYPLNSRMI